MFQRALSCSRHARLASLWPSLVAAALLAGCASQPGTPPVIGNTRSAKPQQTIIVPADPGPLATALRESLSAEGWQTARYSTGASNMADDARAMAQRARYRLTLTSSTAGACRNDNPSFLYQISIIENASGKVPLAMSGGDCLDNVRTQFRQELLDDGLSLKPRVQTDQVPISTPQP